MKKIPLILGIIIFVAAIWVFKKPPTTPSPAPSPSPSPLISPADIFQGVSYVPVDQNQFDISILAQNLIAPTRLKITPNGKHLLVTQLTGDVLAFNHTSTGWDSTPYQVTKVETKAPGFPPDEFGLVGLVFSADYQSSHKIFLLYNFKETDDKFLNRISSVTLKTDNDRLVATNLTQIFQAVTPGNVSHQITDGLGIMHFGKPHIVFLIGEGFHGELAQDETAEAGKLMMIQEDGTYPQGPRPYPNRPKLEALGIRNAYVMAQNPHYPKGRWLIADTGPDKYDRLIYTRTATDSATFKPVNFAWNGETATLAKPIRDPNFKSVTDMVIYRFPETRTVTGFVFDPQNKNSLYMTLFGVTGSPENSPGKEIWQGTLTNLTGQPKLTFKPIITRHPDANGKLGNPIGLEIDPSSSDFFFADILEGRIYQVKPKE